MMESMDNNSDKYILLSEVANKCSSLAEKWNFIANESEIEHRSLEDELINRAVKQQLYLYCFKPVEPTLLGLGKKWFYIWSNILNNFQGLPTAVRCQLFPVGPGDRIKFAPPIDNSCRLEDINTSELYLNLDELKKLEESDQDFADLVWTDSDLAREDVKVETDSTPKEPNNTKPTVSKKEISIVPIIYKPVDFQPSKDASESAFSSTPDSEIVTATDTQLSLASEIVQESHSIAQAEKPKLTKQPKEKKKKKEKTNPSNINEAAEPPLLSKDDRVPLPCKTFADLQTRNLSLEDIIGNRDKGIPAIIPVGKSTWYAGVKSGRYPKSFEVSEGRVAWRGSDIYTLLQKMGLV